MCSKQNPNSSAPFVPDAEAGRRLLKSLLSDDLDGAAGIDLPRIRGYVPLHRLGAGGGGEVVCAVREGSDQLYAVKIVHHGLDDPQLARRAWTELDLLSCTRLPCLPRVHDYGIHDGRLFIVTDYIEGLPLDHYCNQHQLDRRARIRILAELAAAAQSLHERLILHRDLKPANVLVDSAGRVYIVDLGIAQALHRGAPDAGSRTVERAGSPAFMAPEQARGERERISTRTDVYSLAATALVILTGRTPHDTDGPTERIAERIANEPVRPVREIDPTLPKSLAGILDKGLRMDPEQRVPSAAEFAQELRRYLNNQPVRSVEVPRWSRMWLAVRRRPLAAALVAAAVPLILVSAVAYFNAKVAAERQLLLKQHATAMQDIARQTDRMIKMGRIHEALVPLAALGRYVRAGGSLEDGLVTFSAELESIAGASDETAESSPEKEFEHVSD